MKDKKENIKSYEICGVVFAAFCVPVALAIGILMIKNDWLSQGNGYVLAASCFVLLAALIQIAALALGIAAFKNKNLALVSAILSVVTMIFAASSVAAPTFVSANLAYVFCLPAVAAFALISFCTFAAYYAKTPSKVKLKRKKEDGSAQKLARIAQLKQLLDAGVLSEQEFAARKAAIFAPQLQGEVGGEAVAKLSKSKTLALFLAPLMIAISIVCISAPTADALICESMCKTLEEDMATIVDLQSFMETNCCVHNYGDERGSRIMFKAPVRYLTRYFNGVVTNTMNDELEKVINSVDMIKKGSLDERQVSRQGYYNLAKIQAESGRWNFINYYMFQDIRPEYILAEWRNAEGERVLDLARYQHYPLDGSPYYVNHLWTVYPFSDTSDGNGQSSDEVEFESTISNRVFIEYQGEAIFHCSGFRCDVNKRKLYLTVYCYKNQQVYQLSSDMWEHIW